MVVQVRLLVLIVIQAKLLRLWKLSKSAWPLFGTDDLLDKRPSGQKTVPALLGYVLSETWKQLACYARVRVVYASGNTTVREVPTPGWLLTLMTP
ncbi:MAG TPA: hypothetical protein VFN35_05320 [Ktedonobacteraceae bacterium]|nr:hypothetical protein [Ktedonobacteraceae bacterium]